ncbi:uncharacterized protein RCO7_11214 [Rhynchosporium graminicola]|uniref:Uncharacterized protein n=1 Tax=Rhynchosporium graminicola TaxID=2792576 RepID=A0A1E1LBH8_9HELO|nr:uncharacterized protein RCO7_11214 [Rhynchosporium commune]
MSSIVPVSERPSRLFIEAFWTILEGIALLLKGTCILFAAIILNAGFLFAIFNNTLFTPVLYSIIALAEFHKLLFGTSESSEQRSTISSTTVRSQATELSHYGKPSANPAETTIGGGRNMSASGEPESHEQRATETKLHKRAE